MGNIKHVHVIWAVTFVEEHDPRELALAGTAVMFIEISSLQGLYVSWKHHSYCQRPTSSYNNLSRAN